MTKKPPHYNTNHKRLQNSAAEDRGTAMPLNAHAVFFLSKQKHMSVLMGHL